MLEGPDGSGKSTQAQGLVQTLNQSGFKVRHVRDPGGTRVGEKIREILLDREHVELSALAEVLLFMASRAQLLGEVIRPAIGEGRIVVCERWLVSTVCYQGYGAGLDPGLVWRLGELATGGTVPDLTLILDVDPEVGLSRISGDPDLIESRPRGFHERVRKGYREVARSGRQNSVLVPAGEPRDVADRILEEVRRVL